MRARENIMVVRKLGWCSLFCAKEEEDYKEDEEETKKKRKTRTRK